VDPEPLISIIGVLRNEDELEITSVMRVETRPLPVGGRPTSMTAMLLGGDGEVIAQAPVYELPSVAEGDCGCGGRSGDEAPRFPAVVQALVPHAERGGALVIRRDGDDIWERLPAGRMPRVESFSATVRNDVVVLEWQVETEGEDEPEIWAQWTGARRGEWRALGTGLRGGRAELPVTLLPPGACTLRLLAGDGFHTATSKTVRLRVPERGVEVTILAPRDGETLVAGQPMRLWAAVTDPRDPEAEPPDARWTLDRKAVAEGVDAFVTAPKAGRHRGEVRVGTGRGASTASVEFVTIDPERELRRAQHEAGPEA
jgi:hypothetical protein